MGLYPSLGLTVLRSSVAGESCLPMTNAAPGVVLLDTSVLFVDLTQFFFFPQDLKCNPVTRRYLHLRELFSCQGPLGRVTFEEATGTVSNTLDRFTVETRQGRQSLGPLASVYGVSLRAL